MKKEVILAIVIGFGIGLLITFGIYTARTALEESPQTSPSPSPASPTQEATASAQLTITTPPAEGLFDTDIIPLEGKTFPEAIVTIISQTGQQIITANKQGEFASEIELVGGANQIKVSAFSLEGERAETSLTVVYSTAKI